MSNFPWLTVAGVIPLAGALAVGLTPGRSAPGGEADRRARDLLVKRIALLTTLATLGVTIAMAVAFAPGGPRFQFTQTYQWIPQFGVHYAVGVDGIALVLIVMTAILMPVVVLASWNDADGSAGPVGEPPPRRSVKTYFTLLLVLETMMIGVFAATDVFLFYVFFEAMLIPMYFMIGSYGVGKRQYAAVKFLLYSLLGGLLMLVAVIALYVYSTAGGRPGTFLFLPLAHLALSATVQKWLFLGFFIAFAIKAPLWPFHTWLPDAATAAQPGAADAARRRARPGRHVRHDQVLPGSVSGRALLHAAGHAMSVIGILYAAIIAIDRPT
jgi:NADH-quinone oxidoreductase subunit M